ncbi:MAG: hypothetical protein IJ447_09835 [Clostridia bacterium]|nr:hypothetical protein [Clostridia bacterium]
MKNKLQEGINILYNMELNNYLMTIIIEDLTYSIDNLGYSELRNAPKKEKGKIIDMGEEMSIPVLVCGIIGVIIGAIVSVSDYSDVDGFFIKIFSSIIALIVGGLIGGVIGAIVGAIIGYFSYKNEVEKEDERINKKYAQECARYEKDKQADNARIALELKQKKILIQQRKDIINRKKEATKKLNSFYQTMGIDFQYRNLVPIGYMNEFIRLGIADKLGGTDGLYYLIRQELRADQMQHSLEEISYKLDSIINNQHQLYNAVYDMNSKCDNLIQNTLKSIEMSAKTNQYLNTAVSNTAITAYNTERIKQELKFQNFMYWYNN